MNCDLMSCMIVSSESKESIIHLVWNPKHTLQKRTHGALADLVQTEDDASERP